jgi:hypothetical protein
MGDMRREWMGLEVCDFGSDGKYFGMGIRWL